MDCRRKGCYKGAVGPAVIPIKDAKTGYKKDREADVVNSLGK